MSGRHQGNADTDLAGTRLKLTFRSAVHEAFSSLLQRPLRTVLTMIGTVLGTAGLVAVTGISSTVQAQVGDAFSILTDTTVTVTDQSTTGAPTGARSAFPAQAEGTVRKLNGVVAAGLSWPLGGGTLPASITPDPRQSPVQVVATAASPGYLEAARVRVASGATITAFEEAHRAPVALVGRVAATQLGLPSLNQQPAIFLSGRPFLVVGIIGAASAAPGLLSSVVVPDTLAAEQFSAPEPGTTTMLIRTEVGAGQTVAGEVALGLRPDSPAALRVVGPPDPQTLRRAVDQSLAVLFYIVAAVTIFIGAIGIASVTLVAVIERRSEFGLRRALGALPRHIAAHVLTETVMSGAIAGLIGSGIGVVTVLTVALVNEWTCVMSPVITGLAPIAGSLVGAVAGLYPAIRAARMEPLEALRR